MAVARYQYETSPRKLEPTEEKRSKKAKVNKKKKIKIVKDVPRQEIKVSKEQRRKQIKLIMFSLVALAVLLVISYRNSQISVKFSEIQDQKKELASLEKENEQTEVNIENSLNLSNIEQQAKEKLAMSKLTNKQTVYITLPKKDYIESASEKITIKEEDDKNWFEKIIDRIFGN
mgnify:FL=1